jgi:2'-5' RNA ligase
MTDSPSRHFLALLPDAAARARLAALPLLPGGRPVHADDLHLTLAFLGDLPAFSPDALMAELARCCRTGPVEVRLDGLECWRGPRAWCAVGEGGAAAVLAEALRGRLEEFGHRHEPRAFRTHVTLQRGLQGMACDTPARPLSPAIRWTSRNLHLLASRARPVAAGQPRYEILASCPLV